jgi:hypothetical protein
LKEGVRHVVGRRISGVIVKTAESSPCSQVFILFDDGRYYEFYSDGAIQGIGGVDPGGHDAVLRYQAGPRRYTVFAALSDPREQRVVDREIAVDAIRAPLMKKTIDMVRLEGALRGAARAGFDWRVLYAEACAHRPKDWPPAPAADTLAPDERA